MFIEVQFRLTFCIDSVIGHEFMYTSIQPHYHDILKVQAQVKKEFSLSNVILS